MTTVLKVDPLKVTFEGVHARVAPSKTLHNLRLAVDALKANQPVAFPTETVYGLGASAQNDGAVASIYKAKNRPADNPLIIHASSRQQLESTLLAGVDEPKIPSIYDKLIAKFWPGPLTILLPLPKHNTISKICTLGQSTFGVRVPEHVIARALIEMSNLPLAAPSANASTRPSPTLAQHVLEDLEGRIPLILDGGPADYGVESTVVDGLISPPQILRPGGVTLEQIKEFGGPEWHDVVLAKPNVSEHETVRTPGMKYRHYSPRAKVVLFAPSAVTKLDAYVQSQKPKGIKRLALLRSKQLASNALTFEGIDVIDLPLGLTDREIQHNLFTRFREADESGADLIIVEGVELENEGLAIMNRLTKAASEHITA